jgi:cation transport ATPase
MNDDPHGQIREMQAELRERPAATAREARTADNLLAEIWERPWIAVALIATVPGIVLAMLGPFGSFAAPFGLRAAYWVPTMALGAGLGATLNMWAEESPLFDRRPIVRFLTVTTLMTAAMSLIAYGVGVAVFGPERMRLTPMLVFYVWALTLVMSMIGAILRARRTTQASAPLPAPADIRPPKLSQRLPVKLQDAAILALEGEDHYVRIHTGKGSDLILLRLSDAIAEMGQTPGARTHRSWWVSKAAVATVRRDNGRIALVLTSGVEVPISRGYASELREAGWLN